MSQIAVIPKFETVTLTIWTLYHFLFVVINYCTIPSSWFNHSTICPITGMRSRKLYTTCLYSLGLIHAICISISLNLCNVIGVGAVSAQSECVRKLYIYSPRTPDIDDDPCLTDWPRRPIPKMTAPYLDVKSYLVQWLLLFVENAQICIDFQHNLAPDSLVLKSLIICLGNSL